MLSFLFAAFAKPASISAQLPKGTNSYYVTNRAPLVPSPFQKLPIGAIKPEGWVQTQLRLEADGFVGHLGEISEYLRKPNNAWLSPTGEGEHGWEELPYWLKGFGDLAYVLDDPKLKDEAMLWINAAIASQREDGWFGPRSNLTANRGKPDVWPNMLMLFALQSYYEHTGDQRVITLMKRYFRWQLNQPDADTLTGYWDKERGGDNLLSVFWLYNMTGEPWLLDLAKKIHQHTAPWADGVPDWHGVNFAQAFREPATYAQLSKDPEHLQATELDYQAMRSQYGEVPGGMYGADENARKGFQDPRQAAETCAMVEMMASDEFLYAQTGDPKWAERCEDVTFNSLPASMTADEKALHYLTAPNMPLADAHPKNPGIQNGGPMLLFDPNDHRCCQHNVAQGWPYYAEHIWMATNNNGLAAAFYAPCEVTAKVGTGQRVTIKETTNFPFEETIRFAFTLGSTRSRLGAAGFPLTLRLPTWCAKPSILINGKPVPFNQKAAYAVIDRPWRTGDRVELRLPMETRLKKWAANKDCVSVERGPLTYSLDIATKFERHGGTEAWPAYEAHPASVWNYGLIPDLASVQFKRAPAKVGAQPFDPANCPVYLTAKARKIPQWQLDRNGLLNTLQPSPAYTTEPVETVKLIPMGAARLRISAFPTVTDQPAGNHWKEAAKPHAAIQAKSSHTYENDTTDALTDGLVPSNSNDQSIPRFTWWPEKGSAQWVELDFPSARTLSHAEVYWFDDREIGGGCRVPANWRLEASVDGNWKPLTQSGGVARDRFNGVDFERVTTNRLRLIADLRPGFSGGILEWTVR